MTAKHADPEYRRNAATIRRQVERGIRPRVCWRCGGPIEPGEPYDVGHRDPSGPPSMANLAPEHRYRRPGCFGNRAAGGRLGAAITNGRRPRPAEPRAPRRTGGGVPSWWRDALELRGRMIGRAAAGVAFFYVPKLPPPSAPTAIPLPELKGRLA